MVSLWEVWSGERQGLGMVRGSLSKRRAVYMLCGRRKAERLPRGDLSGGTSTRIRQIRCHVVEM